MKRVILTAAAGLLALAAAESDALRRVAAGDFRWNASAPLIAAQDRDGDSYYSIKDPSVVRYRNRWHLFCTLRGQKRSHQIEYLSFDDWGGTAKARRQTMRLSDKYFCAPEVFYFTPQKKWYLICQIVDPARDPALQPAYSTTNNISDPSSWTRPALLVGELTKGTKNWIDFWVIADATQAHLFYTSLNGKMWRIDTRLADFPRGWGQPQLALEGDIYEASHTYRLKGAQKYLTLVEAQAPGGRRYYKAYLADRLDGAWTPAAATLDHPFAGPSNVAFSGERWSDSFSHGELLRDGYDQTLTVDPAHLTFLFQGVSDRDRQGKVYGQIPWRLGLLRPTS